MTTHHRKKDKETRSRHIKTEAKKKTRITRTAPKIKHQRHEEGIQEGGKSSSDNLREEAGITAAKSPAKPP